MSSYDVIRAVIIENNAAPTGGLLHAIEARLTADPNDTPATKTRKIFPLVLGKDVTGTVEMLQCYQYFGHSKQTLEDNFSKKNYRCFPVSVLKNEDSTDPEVRRIVFAPVPVFTINKLKVRDVKRQNCVDEDHVDVFYT